MNKKQFFAEIFEGNLSEWTGICWKWDVAPQFGSLVVNLQDNGLVYGIVYDIKTGSNDPVRSPISYQKTHEELQRDQPQIFAFLQTTFQCITVGYQDEKTLFYHLPGQPPKIHSFIRPATQEEYELFFKSDQFLHILFNRSSITANFDELLLAIIKNLDEKKCFDKNRLTNFIETFSILCKNDYQKLKVFLYRIQHVTK